MMSRRHAYLTVSETKLEYILEINNVWLNPLNLCKTERKYSDARTRLLRLQLFQQNINLLPKFIDIGCLLALLEHLSKIRVEINGLNFKIIQRY